jgi:alkanesulfonate monooxygenase SsuD/methylene tetrahydromethanopterin reductase-like flavin-dependent oxidoreductase (luciferase family)
MTSTVFAAKSISIRVYVHNELRDPTAITRQFLDHALAGLAAGFDGVMIAEHHGSLRHYPPNPSQLATFVLESSSSGWAAACPLLLPLRPTALVAEETAWLGARHPGRVGLGVGAGYAAQDFEAFDVPPLDAAGRFKVELPRLVNYLSGRAEGLLAGDLAIDHCRHAPIPVLSAVGSVTAAKRAAAAGAGMLLMGSLPLERLANQCAAYIEAGGCGPRITVRRVWLGAPPEPVRHNTGANRFVLTDQPRVAIRIPEADRGVLAAPDPNALATALLEEIRTIGASALNLSIQAPGISPEAMSEQISALAEHVIPPLRKAWRDTAVEPDKL